MRQKNIALVNESKDHSMSNEDGSKNYSEHPLTYSPGKMNRRKSVSLLNFSDISSKLDISKKPISSDTLGSGSSIWNDSGYNQSENSLTSDKNINKDIDSVNSQEKILRLQDDLKYKDLIISSIYEINNSLRMKLAKAENKIFELRVKSESHCKCCAFKAPGNSFEYFSPEMIKHQYKYSVSPITKSEPCLIVQAPAKEETKETVMKSTESELSSPDVATCNKLTQWQNTYKEDQKRLLNNILQKIRSPSIELNSTCSQPESLPHTMSYMETSRALIETYQKRREKCPDLISFQVIGDHSVAVSPVQLVQGSHVTGEPNTYLNELEKKKSDPLQESRKVSVQLLPGKQSVLGNIFLRNQKSSRLSHCLSKAQEYAATLSESLTKFPSSLHEIRSTCGMLPLSLHDSAELFMAFAYVMFCAFSLSFVYSLFRDPYV